MLSGPLKPFKRFVALKRKWNLVACINTIPDGAKQEKVGPEQESIWK